MEQQPFNSRLNRCGFQGRSNLNFEFRGKRDEAAVESTIMERAQAKAVSRIDSVGPILRPWNNVTGDQQIWYSQASDAASAAIRGEHRSAKKLLIDPLLDDPFALQALRGD